MNTDAERANAYDEAIRVALRGLQARIWTALPGEIVSFDPVKQTAVIQPTIQAEATAADGSVSLQTLPVLLDCPVIFPSGGGVTLTFPIAVGDECLAIFASRCIDSTWQQGGVQPQAELRMHDLSDGFALVGFRSQPRKLTSVNPSTCQLRSDDHSTLIELDAVDRTITLIAPNGATVDANVLINGDLTVTGNVSFTGASVTHGGVNIGKTHVHAGVQAGGSNTAVPH